MNQEDLSFIPTGIKAYDDRNGGFFYSSLVTLGATTGGGKSMVSLNMNMNMSMYAQEDTAFVPLEMSRAECTARMLSRLTKIPHLKILLKKLTESEILKIKRVYKKYRHLLEEQETRCDLFKPDQDLTIEEVLMSLKPFGYRVITIDYISLLKGVDGDDAWQKLGQAARYSKIYAENNNCVVILLCQVSQEGVVRYARSIAEHSSNSWIWTPSQDDTDEELELLVKQVKGRNQDRFHFKIGINRAISRLYEVANPYDFSNMPEEKPQQYKGKKSQPDGKQSKEKQTRRVQISEDGPIIDADEAEEYVEKLKK